MRRRISFIKPTDRGTDSKEYEISRHEVKVQDLQAARQERLTLWHALNELHELHIRWISPHPFPHASPFLSLLSPGLHVFYTPLTRQKANLLCPILFKTFHTSPDCSDFQSAFTRPTIKSERFTTSAAFQYHESLSSLSNLAVYLQDFICRNESESCFEDIGRVAFADNLDFDWDAVSQSVTLDVYFQQPSSSRRTQSLGGWKDQVSNYTGYVTTEIGIFQTETPTEDEHISLGGVLIMPGKDEKARSTMFQFPSRHHQLPSQNSSGHYLANIIRPTGLHPKLRVSFPFGTKRPQASCEIHTYLTIPSSLFADKYQLASSNFAASNNLKALHAISGETDLEAPDWSVTAWGSTILIELAPPVASSSPWSADIPLHLRYQRQSNKRDDGEESSATENALFPWPVVFWACPAEASFNMKTNPFDRVNLGYDALFGPKTLFYHLEPIDNGTLLESIPVPRLSLLHSQAVEIISVFAVLFGSLWIMTKLLFQLREVKRKTD